MSRKQKHNLIRILLGGVLMGAVILAGGYLQTIHPYARLAGFIIPYVLVGGDVLFRAIRNIRYGQIFDENFLMAIATIGAFVIGEYPEAVAVMLFYQVGEMFQSYAVGRSRSSIAGLMDIRPDYANVEGKDGLVQVDPEEVAIGQEIVIKAGERIPLDGVVLEGSSSVNTAALTGEALPREVEPGDNVISGCVNINGLLRVRVNKAFEESTVSRILDLVENASSKKAKAENFITKFARYYTPGVVFAALLLAVIPPLFFSQDWADWVQRGLIFLVISCPCALVISIPLSFFGGIGGASKCGILVKGGNYLEALSKAETVVFDKTGTLTKGIFQVTEIVPQEMSKEELLALAALAESYSDHPISRSLKEAWGKTLDASRLTDVEEIAGHGVRAVIDGNQVFVGNGRLMDQIGVSWKESTVVGTTVYVAVNGTYKGCLIISDQVKESAARTIAQLKAQGIQKIVMLTGDRKEAAEVVARELGVDEIHAQLLPGDKVDQVERLLAQKKGKGFLAFVGDGINDAPVLSRADIGIAMGALGSDAAIEAADVVLMDDSLAKISIAISISKKTLRIVKQNITFALGIKALVLVLGAMGMANMWEAVFADVGVSVIAILNAARALNDKKLIREANAPQEKNESKRVIHKDSMGQKESAA